MATTQQLTVTLHFDDESTQDVTAEATYESSATGVATVSEAGLITAVSEGSATITATYGAFTDTCAVTVDPEPEPEPENIEVSPSSVTLDHP